MICLYKHEVYLLELHLKKMSIDKIKEVVIKYR